MLRIEVPAIDAEVVADALWAAGASAVGEAADGDVVVLTCDLNDCPGALTSWPHAVSADDGSWWDGWRPFARAARTGVFVVRPPWVATVVPDGAIELVVDAGRSFGTGSHPSTLLALAAVADLVAAGSSVVDVGCGSGALAIGAALLGASRVVAIDLDTAAIAATKENATRNGVAHVVDVSSTPLGDVAGTFDVVVANLGSPLVVDLAPQLSDRCAAAGGLVLGGLLADRWEHVPPAYPAFALVASDALDGWRGLVLRRSVSARTPERAFWAHLSTPRVD